MICQLPDYQRLPKESLEVVQRARKIALVGASPKEERPSYQVMKYLLEKGFSVYPVNPGQKEILGQRCFPSLSAIPKEIEIDTVIIFRRPEMVFPVVKEALKRGVKAIWLQEGIENKEAEELARKKGIVFVSNLCFKKVHQKLQTS